MYLQIIFLILISPSIFASNANDGISFEKISQMFHDMKEINDRDLLIDDCNKVLLGFVPNDKRRALHPNFSKFGANCSKFIDESGNYGEWGQVVAKYLEEDQKQNVFFHDDLFQAHSNELNACPNWKSLNKAERAHFWVWVMASIAYKESTCKDQVKGDSIHEGQMALGLLQLDSHSENLNWRGPNCKASSIHKAETNLRCGLDIMSEMIKGERGLYKSSGSIWGRKSNSFWAELRKKNGGKIAQLIKTHPLCFNK